MICVLAGVGDTVSEDEVVCEIETDKVRPFAARMAVASSNTFGLCIVLIKRPVVEPVLDAELFVRMLRVCSESCV